MALNIKNEKTERLAAKVAALAGESKTHAITVALEERLERLLEAETVEERTVRLRRFMEEEIWPQIPADVRGTSLTREQLDEILGYGPEGF